MGKENKWQQQPLMCIQLGLTNVEKDILVKYFKGEQHKRAADLQTESKVRSEGYQ